MINKSFLILLFALLSYSTAAVAQRNATETVVYLKNGGSWRGQLIVIDSNQNVKLRIAGGSVVVTPANEVHSIKEEAAQYSQRSRNNRPLFYKEGPVWFSTEFSLPFGENRWGISSGVDLRQSFGYRIKPSLAVGMSYSVSYFSDFYVFFPLSVSVRGDLNRSKRQFYYFGDLGYGPPADRTPWIWWANGNGRSELSNGFVGRAGFGMKFVSRRGVDFGIFTAFQHGRASLQTTIEEFDSNWNPIGTVSTHQVYRGNRIAIGCGIFY